MEEYKKLILTRVFDASRDKVWKYWIDPSLVKQWWGPRGVTIPTCEWEAKPQGKIHIVMLAGAELGPMAGQEWPMTGTFEEVVEPQKLVFAANAIMGGKPILETLTTVVFAEEKNKTSLTVSIEILMALQEAEGPIQGMETGWNQQLDKLGKSLPSPRSPDKPKKG